MHRVELGPLWLNEPQVAPIMCVLASGDTAGQVTESYSEYGRTTVLT